MRKMLLTSPQNFLHRNSSNFLSRFGDPSAVGDASIFYGDFPTRPPSPGFLQWSASMRRVSQNVTENVPVPSSEHVAEIVGRQGCKIKALRAKTNTYIKTPVRGEEPIFVVTGRPDDVQLAKDEILSAADHFTQIRASRRHSQGGPPAPGHVTAYVRVPYRVVGLVVGPKGATIKRIQQDTHTYIITPSRDREPIFEVTGLPENVESARREIEMHIYTRTGNLPITNSAEDGFQAHKISPTPVVGAFSVIKDSNDFHLNGNDAAFTGETRQMYQAAISKPGLGLGGLSSYPCWSSGITTFSSSFPDSARDLYAPTAALSINQGLGMSDQKLTQGHNSDEGLGESPASGSSLPQFFPAVCGSPPPPLIKSFLQDLDL